MANPVGFEGANFIFRAPDGVSQNECSDLETFNDGQQIISCWRLTDAEIANVIETGVVWLSIQGQGMPLVLISGDAMVNIGDRPSKAEPYIAPAKRKE